METSLRWVGVAGGLPPPTCQYPVTIGNTTFFVDLAWKLNPGMGSGEDQIVIGEEYDGREKYADDNDPLAPLMAEKAREDALRAVGVRLRRRVAEDLRDRGLLFADMQRRFPESVRRGIRPVPGLYVPRDFGDMTTAADQAR